MSAATPSASAAAMAPFALDMTRFIRAPRERVYDAFIEQEALRIWKCARGMHVADVTVDARVGGQWRMVMQSPRGDAHAVGGTWRELDRPSRLAYTWQWEAGPMAGFATLIEVTLSERDGGTWLEMHHSGFPAEAARNAHSRGWNGTLNRLTEMLDPRGSATTLTLYGHPASTYTRTARMALAEKGVDFTFAPGGPHTPAVLALNPFGYLPVLADGSFAIHETSAIVRYVDECFAGPLLVPGSAGERARCEQWVSAFNAHLYGAIVKGYVHLYFFPASADGAPDRTAIDQAATDLPPLLAILDRGYAASPWLAGDALSMADLFVAPALAYLAALPEGPQLLAATPHLRRALEALRARPSFIATEPPARSA